MSPVKRISSVLLLVVFIACDRDSESPTAVSPQFEILATMPGYEIESLFAPPSAARGLSESGAYVVLNDLTVLGQPQGYFWSAATGAIHVGNFGGFSTVHDINDNGVAAGTSSTPFTLRAFRWTLANGLEDLGDIGGGNSGGGSINANGDIVGVSVDATFKLYAVRWPAAGGTQVLPGPGGTQSNAHDINDSGDVAGCFYPSGGGTRAAVWKANGTIVDIGNFGFDDACATHINNAGTVVGYTTSVSSAGLFTWTEAGGGQLLDPQGAYNDIADLNNAGVMLVATRVGANRSNYRLVIPGLPRPRDVLLPNGHSAGLNALNDRGDIAGSMGPSSGVQEAVVLRARAVVPTPPRRR